MNRPAGGGDMSLSIRCLILGHDDTMVRAPERLSLRCDHCGRETPGWSLGRARAPLAQSKPRYEVATRPGLPLQEAERVAA
jgi:hypothetical protein